MRAVFLFVLASIASAAPTTAAKPDPWTAEPPPAISFGKHDAIPADDIFEVVASMREDAVTELQKIPLIPLSDAQARKFTGAYYLCPKGKRPFLVRALYGFAGTGKFWVYRIKREIWVLHESLGREFASQRTALVVNLDFDPAKAYVTVSIIK
jgi:hypothetical protein